LRTAASCSGNFDIYSYVEKYLANKNGDFVQGLVRYSENLKRFNIIDSEIKDEDEEKDTREWVSS